MEMNRKEKELLLKDLSARISYNLYATVRDPEEKDAFQPFEILGVKEGMVWVRNKMLCIDHFDTVEVVKPYLRPMSSITIDEYSEIKEIDNYYGIAPFDTVNDWEPNYKSLDWLNSHHFDYRGLIEKGLALEAPEGMYK